MANVEKSFNFVYREAIAVFARTGPSGKRIIKLNANAFSCHLRISACICGLLKRLRKSVAKTLCISSAVNNKMINDICV
jgi:hypothetical protein